MMHLLQRHRGLFFLIVLYVILAWLDSITIPLGKAPDEYVHFLYVRFLIDHGRPPINIEEQTEAGYKSDQPPLYHSLVALLTTPIDVSEPPSFKFSWEPASRQLIDIVLPRALLIRTNDETWPFKGLFLAWFAGRWISILLSSLTLIITYFTALEIFPGQRWLALAASGTLAFMPRFIVIGSVLSDDNMVSLLMVLFLFTMVRLFKYKTNNLLTFAIAGGLVGLALSTKYTVLPVPFEAGLLILWLARRQQWTLRVLFTRLVVFGLTMAIVASAWFGFLWWHFNQIREHGLMMGLIKPIMAGGNNPQETAAILNTFTSGAVASHFSEGGFWDWCLFLFTQFWDVPIFGAPQPYPLVVVLLLAAILCLLAIFGWWRRWQQNKAQQRGWLGILTLHLIIFIPIPFLRFISIGDIHDTAQARHILFPAASAIAIVLVAGVIAAFTQKWQKMAGFTMTGFVFMLTLAHLYYYIVGFPAPLPVRTDPSMAEEPDHVTPVEFSDGLLFRGYDWQLINGQILALNLHWRANALFKVDYRTEITLRDSRGKCQLRWLSHPAAGRFPTRAWDVGDSVRDTLNIPLVGLSPDSYEVTLRLLDWHEAPLPSTQGDTIPLFTFDIDRLVTRPEPSLWQNGQIVNRPTYRYRATIPLTGLNGQDVTLVDAYGQTRLSLSNEGPLHLFIVDYDWPSGEYRVQVDGVDTQLRLYVENFEWDFSLPEMTYTVNVDFNDEIRLLGYDLPSRRVKAGEGVPLVLYWQGLRQMMNSYIIFDRLLDVEHKAWGGYDRLPKETYPTNLWVPNEIVTDGFAIPVDPTTPDGIYNIVVGLYDEADSTARSLSLSQAGQPLEMTSVTIGPIKVGGPPPEVVRSVQALTSHTPLSVELGEPPVILLRGYKLTTEDGVLKLRLDWESLAQTPTDWFIFVHLRSETGQTVAQKDGPAGSGLYPSSLWDAGEMIADQIILPFENLPGGRYTIFIGLYDVVTAVRLPVPGNPANEILLDEIVIDNE
jgi:4-amino-4-deoxy-L-arabinose transferase-like glycosyltransferase